MSKRIKLNSHRILCAAMSFTISCGALTPNISVYAKESKRSTTVERKLPSANTALGGFSNTSIPSDLEDVENDDGTNVDLSDQQRQSINMLNYMTVLTQEINEGKRNRVFLDAKYNSLVNDMYPNAVDGKTETQITKLLDTIYSYLMVDIKRERLEYIFEQNRAQAMREAIPNPIGLLSAVQSGTLLKGMISVIYMAADSVDSYHAATSQAELQYLKDGWELDDEESAALHNSTKDQLTYMLDMVRDYDLPGDYALSQEAVEDFSEWTDKEDDKLVSKISWLESHEDIYKMFGPYWLELAKDYYASEDYRKCLAAVKKYESIASRIFRKDDDYAKVLPLAIYSSKETESKEQYTRAAEKYCKEILSNTKDSDWELKYFAAQTYLDLYASTKNSSYLKDAYDIAFNNVVILIDEQEDLNEKYLNGVEMVEVPKGATKRQKKEIKAYNKMLKKQRKTELPPVSEPLYVNAELLFSLAKTMNISSEEKSKINSILHPNDEYAFLTFPVDDDFCFDSEYESTGVDDIIVYYHGGYLSIPAFLVTNQYSISATVNHAGKKTVFDDFKLLDVDFNDVESIDDYKNFRANFSSNKAYDYNFASGDEITVSVTPKTRSAEEATIFPEKKYNFTFKAYKRSGFHPLDKIDFKRQ